MKKILKNNRLRLLLQPFLLPGSLTSRQNFVIITKATYKGENYAIFRE